MPDWKQIQREYIEGSDSIDTLANRHGVNRNTARYHFRKERWTEKRQEARRRADEIIIETAAEHRAQLAALLDQSALLLLQSIIATIERHKDGGYTRLTHTGDGKEIVFDLLDTVDALARIARVYGLDAASRLDRDRLDQLKHGPECFTGESVQTIVIETRPDRDLHELLENAEA